MKNGVCPKCRAEEIYRGFATEGEGLTAGSYVLFIEIMTGKTQTTLWADTYICRACGYLEMYVSNCEHLAELSQADGWAKVTPVTFPNA
jgi:hypothetical protein